ncbi:hypothetical protein T492DRAFT_1105788, partial [Pavlovales sp. CCMP2436]
MPRLSALQRRLARGLRLRPLRGAQDVLRRGRLAQELHGACELGGGRGRAAARTERLAPLPRRGRGRQGQRALGDGARLDGRPARRRWRRLGGAGCALRGARLVRRLDRLGHRLQGARGRAGVQRLGRTRGQAPERAPLYALRARGARQPADGGARLDRRRRQRCPRGDLEDGRRAQQL